jgi:RNA polymerase-binding transcription factor DksA
MYTKAKKNLKARKKYLKDRIKEVKTSLTSQRNQDWSEAAIEAENDEVLEGIFTETSQELLQVDYALQRIEQGRYSICSECNEKINKKRLKIMPYTSLCIKCAQKLEYASLN